MKKNYPVTGREVAMRDDETLISTTDLKGRITYVNPAFVRISGFSEEELLGSAHNIVRHPDMPPQAFEDLWQTIKAGQSWQGIVKNRTRDGDHYWVEAFVTPVYEKGQIVGYQSVRSKPSREQIERAERLYEKFNQDPNRKIRKPLRPDRLGLGTRMWLGFGIMLLLLLALMGLVQMEADRLTEQVGQMAAQGADKALVAQVMAEIDATRVRVLALAGLLLFGMGLMAWRIQRVLIGPLKILRDIAMGIASGDLEQDIKVKTRDEMGHLFLAMKLMQARLKTVIERILNSSNRATALAEDFRRTAQETAQHLQTQQAETEQVATAMNEMTATVAEVARNTEQAAGAAHQAMNEVDSGSATVDAVRNAINRLASEVETSAHSVQELADKSQNISNILEVIRGIAEQTNLLALNAAIEAARAGEQGRGFAVVADEVRSLAKRTQDATVEIKEVIDELQGGIGDVVAVMERGREQAEIAVTQAGEADASLQTIREAVHHINEMNAQIATAATEQEAVAEEMNRNIVTISQMTAEVAEDADQNAHASADLATVLGQLQEQLSVFHIKTSSHFDFEKAKAAHLAWKGRLRNYLDGDRSALTKEQAVSHRHCVLGKWYYGEGMQQYGDLPEFKDIEPPHAELHKIIKEILNLKEAGRDDEAEELYKQVEPISKRIVSLLDEVERKATAA